MDPVDAPDLPVLNNSPPVLLATDDPDAMVTAPVRPTFEVPELKRSMPDGPPASVFAVRRINAPEDEELPPPDMTSTAPPELDDWVVDPANTYSEPPSPAVALARPARTAIAPPTPVSVVPTISDTAPARPEAATPVDNNLPQGNRAVAGTIAASNP